MERFRVCAPDTLQLHAEVDSTVSSPVSSTLKVVSYSKGSCDTGNFTVSKFPDGTIVLDDGKNKVVQRPYNHPERRAAQRVEGLRRLRLFFNELARMFFGRTAT